MGQDHEEDFASGLSPIILPPSFCRLLDSADPERICQNWPNWG
jgi:hypothetical protein